MKFPALFSASFMALLFDGAQGGGFCFHELPAMMEDKRTGGGNRKLSGTVSTGVKCPSGTETKSVPFSVKITDVYSTEDSAYVIFSGRDNADDLQGSITESFQEYNGTLAVNVLGEPLPVSEYFSGIDTVTFRDKTGKFVGEITTAFGGATTFPDSDPMYQTVTGGSGAFACAAGSLNFNGFDETATIPTLLGTFDVCTCTAHPVNGEGSRASKGAKGAKPY